APREHRRGTALLPEPDGDAPGRASGSRLSDGAPGAERTREEPTESTSLHPGPLLVLRPGAGDVSMRFVGRGALLALILVASTAGAQIRLEGVDLSGEAEEKKEKNAGELGLDLREEGGPVVSDGLKARVRAATRLFDEQNYEAAALGFWEILQDPKAATAHPRAEYM